MLMEDIAALFAPQNRRLIKLTTPLSADQELLVDTFVGNEGLSTLFHYDLSLISQDAHIELKSLIGKPALLEIELAEGGARLIHGYVNDFASGGSDGGLAYYSATLVPWLWMLSRRFDSRIFQDQTVEQVLTQVFAGYGSLPSVQFNLTRPLKPHSYITQYRESDFNFVQRLLDQEGLFYYFEHSHEQHTLVIGDNSTLLTALPEQPRIRFHSTSVTETADAITHWSGSRQLLPSRMAVQTFDYKQPRNALPVVMDSINQQGDVGPFEIFDFPGQYTHGDYDTGERLVRNRLEALEVQAKVFAGSSNCRAMRTGHTFELQHHYEHDQGSPDDRRFLLLALQHEGANNYRHAKSAVAYYRNHFTCIRSKIPYRPQPTTERPLLHGPQTAIVVGPPGEEIFTDSLGRVKLQFHWDRYGQHDDNSSCWVRVAQAWASGGFGSIQIPRVGDEVVVSFLEGNPDRPLVTGSLYNSQNMPPWSLPQNKTQSGFLTRSTKSGSDAANFIRFDDKQGAEQLLVHAERCLDTEVELDETHSVGNNRSIAVGGNQYQTVQQDAQVTITQGAYSLAVTQKHVEIQANTHITLRVGNSSLTLTPQAITLKADAIHSQSTGETRIEGEPIKLNQ